MSNIEKSFNSKSYTISIPTINDVKEFVTIVNNFACNATIESGRYIVDAKSIMGILQFLYFTNAQKTAVAVEEVTKLSNNAANLVKNIAEDAIVQSESLKASI